MVLTILEATVAPERVADLQAAFRAAAAQVPPGFIRSHLASAAADPTRWRIETLWTSREALAAMRQTGTPAGVLMFRAAGKGALDCLRLRRKLLCVPLQLS